MSTATEVLDVKSTKSSDNIISTDELMHEYPKLTFVTDKIIFLTEKPQLAIICNISTNPGKVESYE